MIHTCKTTKKRKYFMPYNDSLGQKSNVMFQSKFYFYHDCNKISAFQIFFCKSSKRELRLIPTLDCHLLQLCRLGKKFLGSYIYFVCTCIFHDLCHQLQLFWQASSYNCDYPHIVMYVEVGENRPFLEKLPFAFVSSFTLQLTSIPILS